MSDRRRLGINDGVLHPVLLSRVVTRLVKPNVSLLQHPPGTLLVYHGMVEGARADRLRLEESRTPISQTLSGMCTRLVSPVLEGEGYHNSHKGPRSFFFCRRLLLELLDYIIYLPVLGPGSGSPTTAHTWLDCTSLCYLR